MQYLGQKFTYTKYVDLIVPTTKQIKVTDADGNKYKTITIQDKSPMWNDMKEVTQ
jgi:hypothetical protein